MFLMMLHHSGPSWDASRPMEEQSAWEEHAAYMDELVERGLIVLGGPLDEYRVVLVFEAASEEAVRAALEGDPWLGSHLEIASIEPWTIRLDGRR